MCQAIVYTHYRIHQDLRACAGEEAWMDLTYSAGWWSSTAGVVMSEFTMPVRMWATEGLLGTSSEFNPGVGLPVRCLKD